MKTDFERVKEAVTILEVITRETGFVVKGKHLEECPMCHGHNCFSIVDDGGFRCFQCDRKGDVFDFLEQYHKIENIDALKMAAQIAGVTIEAQGNVPKAVNATVKHRIFEAAKDYYLKIRKDGEGDAYLKTKRGHDERTLDKFSVGWSDGKIHKHLKAAGYSDKDLVESGLVKENLNKKDEVTGYYSFFPEKVAIFPHEVSGRIGHFTIKDPTKVNKHQLPNTAKDSSWKFYNQKAFKAKEILLVEGEHDLLSIYDAGFINVMALIGNMSDKQLKELESKAKHKRLYLWLDKDEAGYKYIRQITTKLKGENYDIRIIEHPGESKDADEYLKAIPGDPKKEVRRLLEEAVPYLNWEISRISELTTQDEKLKQLRVHNIFTIVSLQVEAEKEVYLETLIKLGFSRKAMEQQLDNNQELREKLGAYESSIPEKERSPLMIAKIIFTYFNEFGRFFHNGVDSTYLLYHHKIYTVGDNLMFNSLLQKYTRMISNKSPGPQVWRALEGYAFNEGLYIELSSWIFVNRVTDSIYINLNCPGNTILRITPGTIEEVDNGLNSEGVLLNSSPKIMPFTYLPDVDIREGMELIRELIVTNLTCDEAQRHLILCWLLTAFMIDFTPHMALMKFSGASSSGKTSGAKLLSLLIYGNEQISDPSGAAAFSLASTQPMLVIDNLEQDNITKQIAQFLLLSTTKGSKEKRKAGSDTATTQETPKSLILITAIEPFKKAEHLNRTIEIEFSHKYHSDGFVEDEIIGKIIKKRDIMLSAILKLIAHDVLPNLKERKSLLTILKKQYPKFSKTRANEYFALMMLILTKVLPHVPVHDASDYDTLPKDVWADWIAYQDDLAKETETGSNMIVKLLDGMIRKFLSKFKVMSASDFREISLETDTELLKYLPENADVDFGDPIYPEKVKNYEDTELDIRAYMTDDKRIKDPAGTYTEASIFFVATSSEMVYALDIYCKIAGLKNPFSNASTFAARLRNDVKVLAASGWSLVTKPGLEPWVKVIKGTRYYMFRKKVRR